MDTCELPSEQDRYLRRVCPERAGRPAPVLATNREPFTSNGIRIPVQADDVHEHQDTDSTSTRATLEGRITTSRGGSRGHARTTGPKGEMAWWRISVVPNGNQQNSNLQVSRFLICQEAPDELETDQPEGKPEPSQLSCTTHESQ